ncbi:MAG TPA: SRPBCC domain-containing protein [Candidatus Polarisedimenticolaceae bacterium]|nr:SRPBCC domain-containing protein [Candidatus Polarisedimenticolaceae bacterium]
MKRMDLTISRLIPGPVDEVFDVWFDPAFPGGPWHDARKALMNLAVDGMFYFGMEQKAAQEHTGVMPLTLPGELLGHFGRFVAVDRPRSVEHTWMSEYTHGIETTVSVTFEPCDGGTNLTIVHRGLPDDERGRKHETGWNFLLSRFEKEFAQAPAKSASRKP